jgi:3-hydroxypropanoate dehydrogenase
MTTDPGLASPPVGAVAPDALDTLYRTARTANTFTADPVSDEDLRWIFDLVKWAPTSGNCQPLRILALRSPESRRRLLPHMTGVNQGKTETAPLTLLLAADTEYHTYLARLLPYLENPAARHADPEFRRGNAEFNATLQAGYLILGIRAAGFAAGPMSGFDKAGVDAEFFPDGRLRSILVINVGRPGPDAWFGRLPRLDAEEVLTVL